MFLTFFFSLLYFVFELFVSLSHECLGFFFFFFFKLCVNCSYCVTLKYFTIFKQVCMSTQSCANGWCFDLFGDWQVGILANKEECLSGQYTAKGECCKLCQPGEGVVRPCGINQTVCAPCLDSEYLTKQLHECCADPLTRKQQTSQGTCVPLTFWVSASFVVQN